MSVTGIASSILSTLNSTQPQAGQNRFQQIRSEFQALGQDLQSGNLTQAQHDFTTLSQDLPGVAVNTGATATANTNATGSSQAATNPLIQAFSQLGQDLQSGNLKASQQDFANIEQVAQQNVQQDAQQSGGHHRHHHRVESNQDSASSSSASSSSSSQQANPITQAFTQLAQDLKGGDLQGAQNAFATLQNDLQQIGGFVTAGSSGAGFATVPASGGSLNVTV
jgi:outer membrane protein assembly factor BamD (BamD/ComL family)